MPEGDGKESLDKFLPGHPAIAIDVEHVKDAVDLGAIDAETGLQLEVFNEFAELRQVDVIVLVFVVLSEDVVHCVAHQLLFRLLVAGHLHGRIGLSKCIIRFDCYWHIANRVPMAGGGVMHRDMVLESKGGFWCETTRKT